MSPPTRVGIVAKRGLVAAREHLERLIAWLESRGLTPVVDDDTVELMPPRHGLATSSRDALPSHVDLVIVLGGDGTLLGMANRIARSGRTVPLLGVNFGSLGFLTETRIGELETTLGAVVEGTATYDDRAMLAATLQRDGAAFDERVALNDVVFTKAALSRIIELSVSVGHSPVTTVKADGLIVGSATGSTAYNLAAGGPIVHPRVDALVLTPIAPHTLTDRPIVIPASEVIEVRPHIDPRADDIYITYDGQAGYPLQAGDVVQIRRAPQALRLVKSPTRTYFQLLREKLNWGERGHEGPSAS